MSTVYRALDRVSGESVAVKVFRPGIELADSSARRRREVELASSLHHSGVVSVLDAQVDESDRADGCAYIVTEYVDGPTLGRRISLAPLTENEAIELGAALCGILAYVHATGIVHRDIKPANVLLPRGDDGLLHPKLADFGIALMVDSTRMTATGFLAGTANYLSPEQVLGQSVTAASDVYSLGLVLLESLDGKTAYAGHGIEAALARLNSEPQMPAWINPALAIVLRDMTARDPLARPSAEAARSRLRRVLGEGLISDVFALGAAPTVTRPTRTGLLGSMAQRRTAAVAIVMAAACAVALILGTDNSSGKGTVVQQPVPATSTTASAPPAQAGASAAPAPTDTATANPTANAAPLVAAHAAPSAAQHPNDQSIPVVTPPAAGALVPPGQAQGKGKAAAPPKPPKDK